MGSGCWVTQHYATWTTFVVPIRPSAPSSVISRPTCFSSSLRCCWQAGSAPFVRRRCDCLASSAPFTNIQTYLLTTPGYLENSYYNVAKYLSNMSQKHCQTAAYNSLTAQYVVICGATFPTTLCSVISLQCFDTAGWVPGRASGLQTVG